MIIPDGQLYQSIFETTQQYVDLEYNSVERRLGSTAMLRALDEHERWVESLSDPNDNMSDEAIDEEIDKYANSNPTAARVEEAQNDFSSKAREQFDAVDGYSLSRVGQGYFRLLQDSSTANEGVIHLRVDLNNNDEVSITKVVRRIGSKLQPKDDLEVTDKDIEVIKAATERLAKVNQQLAEAA